MQFLCFSHSVLCIASALLFFSPALQSIYLSFLPVGTFIRGDRALSTGASPWLWSRTVMDTGGRQQPARRSMALESLCASRVLAGMWWAYHQSAEVLCHASDWFQFGFILLCFETAPPVCLTVKKTALRKNTSDTSHNIIR